MRRRAEAAALGLVALACAGAAQAEPLRDLCTDRPGLGTPACIMDKGHFDVELGLADWTLDRQPGQREDDVALGDILVRYGLTDRLEAQIGWTAYTHIRTRAGAAVTRTAGTGDVTVALRQSLAHPDGSRLSVAIMPYATLPVGSRGIGAGDWAAGLIVPVDYALPHDFQLGLTAEIDAAADQDGRGRHLAYSAVLGLDIPLAHGLAATVELSAARDEDPTGHSTQLLAGVAADWAPGTNLQFDAGAVLGLNRDAPDEEVYLGVSRRF